MSDISAGNLQGESGEGPVPPKTVFIVEDHEMLAQALALSLSARGFECAVADLTLPEGVVAQARRHRPALVLLDLDLGNADGLDLVPGLRATGARVLVVTGYTDEQRLTESVALGANGWVSKTEPFERLLEAAELVIGGVALFGVTRLAELEDMGRANLEAERGLKEQMASLTQREREVLDALAEGRVAEDIAERLFVSVGTVRTHIRGILTKLGVSSQLAAVAKARDLAAYR